MDYYYDIMYNDRNDRNIDADREDTDRQIYKQRE